MGVGAESCAFIFCVTCCLLLFLRPCSGVCGNFFGTSPVCGYRCHCTAYWSCDDTRGVCNSRGCARGYSGTSCQYDNFAFESTTEANFSVTAGQENLSRSVDGNTSSCFLERGSTNLPVAIDITERSWVSVINIALSRSLLETGQVANSESLEVTYYDSDNISQVLHPHLAQPNDTTITYHLAHAAVVTRVQIRAVGDVSLALCEISVLGGRNLAIKKPATQGDATYCERGNCFSADRAVDGGTSTKFSDGSCSHTDRDKGDRAWWTVFLGYSLTIWRLKVYSRQDYEPSRMAGFRVKVTLQNGTEAEVYRNNETEPKALTDIILPQPLAVRNVTVWHQGTGKTLWPCEVEAFGDCMDGYYGWLCQSKCQCKDPAEICDKIWGYCPHSHCKPGFRGDNCTLKCQSPRYGDACAFNCSDGCVNDTCHHVTGNCTNGCRAGWQRLRCDEKCSEEHYGQECRLLCSDGCRDRKCDHVTGMCDQGCLPGWLGNLCNETCDVGYHGENCSLTCSSDCVNNSCDVTSGHCLFGCRAGISGDVCELPRKGSEDEVPWLIIGGAVGGVLLLIVLVIITVAVCRYRKRKPKLKFQKRPRQDYENSSAILMDSLQVEQQPENGKGDCLYAVPNKAGKGNKAHENDAAVEKSIAPDERTTPTDQVDTAAAPTVVTANNSSAPTPQPRTAKPELLSLFSRDVNHVVNDENDDEEREDKEEQRLPSSKEKGELASSSARSSPRSQRASPCVPARREISIESLDTLSVDDLDVGDTAATPPRTRRTTGDYYNVVCRDTSPTTVIPLSELPARVVKWLENPRHFSKERAMLPGGKVAEWKTAMLPENVRKNRYKDIYPYDHSRVLLDPLPECPHSDFYNACYIDGYEKEKAYIAAQGPMDRTLYDFLRMIWDVNCARVVMLTNTVEFGRFKCQQYWPDEEELSSGDITVRVNSVTNFADYCIRHLIFERGGVTRTVMMYHYTAWPDNFAPASPWSLLDFRQKVNGGAHDEGPLIVHCSAGIGRTGTYIALDIQLSRAQYKSDVDVFACVWKLRQQRISMVQTLAQYIFIHETLLASLMTLPPVPVPDFDLNGLLAGEIAERTIDKEYAQLQMCLGPTKQENSENIPPEILGLPRDVHRVHIVSADGGSTPAYINAVFLSNYSQANAFIQTHTPTDEDGAVNFLSMVLQSHVTSVVCLDPEQSGTYSFWPECKGGTNRVGPYNITLLSSTSRKGISVKNLHIIHQKSHYSNSTGQDASSEVSLEVSLFTCTTWPPSRFTPPSVSAILDLEEIARPKDSQPVVVYCRDGHTRSGLFCIAAAVLERMRIEDHVAANYVTAHMRVPRRENIVNIEQYEFLYKCAQCRLNGVQTDRQFVPTEAENTYGNVDEAGRRTNGGEKKVPEPENEYGNIGFLQAAPASESTTVTVIKKPDEDVYAEMKSPTAGPSDSLNLLAANDTNTTEENTYWDMKAQGGGPTKTKQKSRAATENAYSNIKSASGTAATNSNAARKADGTQNVKASEKDEHPYGNILDSAPTNTKNKGVSSVADSTPDGKSDDAERSHRGHFEGDDPEGGFGSDEENAKGSQSKEENIYSNS